MLTPQVDCIFLHCWDLRVKAQPMGLGMTGELWQPSYEARLVVVLETSQSDGGEDWSDWSATVRQHVRRR